MLIAAASMSGVTAFDVSHSTMSGNAKPIHGSPEVAAGSALGSGNLVGSPTFRPSRQPIVSGHLADARGVSSVRSPVAPERNEITIAFGGDILIHNGTRASAAAGDGTFDFFPLLEQLEPVIAGADLALCHLEVPLSGPDTDYSSYPKFNAPAELATGIARVGFDGCSTASNHSLDQGIEGLNETLDILDETGLGHAGTARSEAEAEVATYYQIDDVTVAHIAGTYWLNGLYLPEDMEWVAQRLNLDQMLGIAARARRDGADLVVVSVHCCTEYRSQPTAEQEEIFSRLSRSPWVDLVVGHHSHVVGPVDQIDGELVIYGLGNLLTGQLHRTDTREGVVVLATAQWTGASWDVVKVSAVPTFVEGKTYTVSPTSPDSGSFLRVMEALNSRGVSVEPYGDAAASSD